MLELIRGAVWSVNGFFDYTSLGYKIAAKNFNPYALDVSLLGKVAVVTGANSGIGYETALALAKRHAEVHLLCRSEEKGRAALAKIKELTKNENLFLHIVDVCNMHSVRSFAIQFINSQRPLHILVNNAGCMLHERIENEEGIELNFATNVLGPYLLTVKLIPLMRQSGSARIIMVSSAGMLTQPLNVNDLQSVDMKPFNGVEVYAQNKRQLAALAIYFAAYNPCGPHTGQPLKIFCAHPGWADTPGVQNSLPLFRRMFGWCLRTPSEGADTIIWAAVAQEPISGDNIPNGAFLQDRKPVSMEMTMRPKNLEKSMAESDIESLVRQCDLLLTRVFEKD